MTQSSSSDDETSSQAAELVRALLERHDIPKHRHASFVGEFFDLSRAASHARVNKSSAWTLDDFQALANRFGEPLSQVLGATQPDNLGIRATLKVGGMEIGCRVWLTDDEGAATVSSLVALKQSDAYVVLPATAGAGDDTERISRIEVTHDATPASRVAVFDGERDVADSMCGMLRSAGIDAVPFYVAEELLEIISQHLFDGYVVDWLLPGNRTALPLLAAIRRLPEHRAAVVLSSKIRNGTTDPREVGDAMTRFNVQLIEKPLLQPLLVAALINDGLHTATRVGVQPA
jgi:hypothetical protein